MSTFSTTITTNANNDNNNVNDKPATIQFLTFPFRRRRKRYTINPPDDTYHVVYLGNVLTILAKGEECLEKPLSLIWNAYCNRQRAQLTMKLTVTRSGLKAETKQQGITEYWSHRITYCLAPSNFPRVFCWVYKHEGKKMKPELRCHAALCKKLSDPYKISQALEHNLRAALQEYRREKLCRQNARLNALIVGQSSNGPKRKLLLQTGSLNFRPPVGRSKSAPRLFAIDEENEYLEEQQEEYSDADSLCYAESPISGDGCSTNSLTSNETEENSLSQQNSFRANNDEKHDLMRKLCDMNLELEKQRNGSLVSNFSSNLECGPSSVSSDDGMQSTDSENRSWKIRRLPSLEKRSSEQEIDTVSEESGYHDFDDGFNSATADDYDDDDDDDRRNSEIYYDDDESQYDEQVTAL